MDSVGQVHSCLLEQFCQSLLLPGMFDRLSWIHHESKIETGSETVFLQTPNLFDLAADPVSLHGSTVMADGYDYDPVLVPAIGRDHQSHSLAGVLPALFENPINLRFLLDNFQLSKAFSHRTQRASCGLWLFFWPKPNGLPWSPCGRGTRIFYFSSFYWAGTFFS